MDHSTTFHPFSQEEFGISPAETTAWCERTQPVAPNILRSRGSPDSSPSILVREWQVAMQATKAEFTRLSQATSVSGGTKLREGEI